MFWVVITIMVSLVWVVCLSFMLPMSDKYNWIKRIVVLEWVVGIPLALQASILVAILGG